VGDSGLFSADVLVFDFEATSVRDGDDKVVGFSEQPGHHSMLTVSDRSGRLGWQIWDTSRRYFGHEWTIQGPDWGGGRFGKPREHGYFIGERLIATEEIVSNRFRPPFSEWDVYDVGNAWIAEIRLLPKHGWRSYFAASRWEVHFLSRVDRLLRALVCAATWTHNVDLHDPRG
jgi:hypothetical protein